VRLVGSFVVDFGDNFSELRNFLLENLLSHGITNTVSVDDEVVWVELLGVLVGVRVESGLKSSSKLLVDDLLSSSLDNLVGEVLTHLLVDGGTESDNGVLTLMADIDTNEHSVGRDLVGEVEVVEVTSKLGVDLSEDV